MFSEIQTLFVGLLLLFVHSAVSVTLEWGINDRDVLSYLPASAVVAGAFKRAKCDVVRHAKRQVPGEGEQIESGC